MNKKDLTEADIRTKYITPAVLGLDGSKWDSMTQVREEFYFTKGRVIVRGKSVKRSEAKKVDYLLYYKPNLPIAVIEAKDNTHALGDGMQQALDYAELLDIPFAYSSNGDGFLEHDRTGTAGPVEREIPLHEFPTPGELWHDIARQRGSLRRRTPLRSRTITMTVPGRPRATTNSTPSTAQSRPLFRVQIESSWSWPPAQARRTQHFRSFGVSLEVWGQEAHPLPCRPQHPCRPNQDK
jgi:type I site-specific restriction endonuclease